MLINVLMLSIGAFIGMAFTSMTTMAKIDDKRINAYFRGLERGRREGRAEGRGKKRD